MYGGEVEKKIPKSVYIQVFDKDIKYNTPYVSFFRDQCSLSPVRQTSLIVILLCDDKDDTMSNISQDATNIKNICSNTSYSPYFLGIKRLLSRVNKVFCQSFSSLTWLYVTINRLQSSTRLFNVLQSTLQNLQVTITTLLVATQMLPLGTSINGNL